MIVSFLNEGWFWGDPHIKTLDGGNYTFNGLGEYTMVDAKNGTFKLQARTKLAQGNSTTATITLTSVCIFSILLNMHSLRC